MMWLDFCLAEVKFSHTAHKILTLKSPAEDIFNHMLNTFSLIIKHINWSKSFSAYWSTLLVEPEALLWSKWPLPYPNPFNSNDPGGAELSSQFLAKYLTLFLFTTQDFPQQRVWLTSLANWITSGGGGVWFFHKLQWLCAIKYKHYFDFLINRK